MAIYNQAYVYWNGALLQENTSVDVSIDGDNQVVLTTVKGFSGITPSPKMTMVTLENVMPPTGMEVDAFKLFIESTEGELKLQSAATGKSLVSKGFIEAPKAGGGVGKTASQSWSFRGEPASFK